MARIENLNNPNYYSWKSNVRLSPPKETRERNKRQMYRNPKSGKTSKN